MRLLKEFIRTIRKRGLRAALRLTIASLDFRVIGGTYKFFERLGVHVIPVHIYEPIPDRRELGRRKDLWENESELVGIDINSDAQLRLLRDVFPAYRGEYEFPKHKTQIASEYYLENGNFGTVDAEVTHSFVRHYLPHKIIEIGSGSSTCLMAKACLMNKERSGRPTQLFAVDPYPGEVVSAGFPGLTALKQEKAENVPMEFFLQLAAGDILFIDSSHVVQTGGDVNYLFLEILPRVKPGVIVHAHDIFLPREYPRDWMFKLQRFCGEQYLLQAFLTYNENFKVFWCSSYMHLHHSPELKSLFVSYDGSQWPTSFWMQRKA